MESSDLLVNLVIALIAALGGALIAARLGQSVILGYIIAGVAIGPYTPGIVGDIATVEALAEIGVILLMFAIGIQFSLRDLLRAGSIATVGSTIQVLAIIGLGALLGIALGWDLIEALFFGAVISNSSSTVLSKVLGERGEMDTAHGQLALAWSTLQDLGTVILIVILSALATDSDSLLLDLGREVGRAGLFLLLLVPVGFRVLPWLFTRVAALRNREVFVLTVAVVALGLAYSASFFGLSLAIGAFVAGVVVSESDLSHQILGEILPLRDIFAGLFFVSVGMLVDPGFVVRNLPLLLVTVLLILAVKGGLITALAWLLGTPTRTAILTGAIMGQCAEFSFLLAGVGQDVGAVSPTVFSLMLAGAAASMVVLPGAYAGVQPLAGALGSRRPSFRAYGGDRDTPIADPTISGHAVICGYGRVGREVGRVIGRRFSFVAIEEDPRIVEGLREQGIPAVQGNAAIPAVLERANPGRARVLILALPDPVATRQIVGYVRERYPRLDVVARTHSETERRFLLERGVDEVILGEWELALEMTRHALHRFGVGTLETQEVIQRRRQQVAPEPTATPSHRVRRPQPRAPVRRSDAAPGAGEVDVGRTAPPAPPQHDDDHPAQPEAPARRPVDERPRPRRPEPRIRIERRRPTQAETADAQRPEDG